ncbi:caspase family protein [Hyphomonas sp. WL0036]|uniref:caspase family protein n=1 Tax=Hyphomonas sediminis TaxID=2866160 RepID=UPI001C82045C|nr:caspase family protein [Hyphomonas sediminis]MBY9067269.1 caspase family protein [Hyphomonas sediminis]
MKAPLLGLIVLVLAGGIGAGGYMAYSGGFFAAPPTAEEGASGIKGSASAADGAVTLASLDAAIGAQPACTPVETLDANNPRLALIIAQTTYTRGPSNVVSAEAEASLIANALCRTGFKIVRHRDLTKPQMEAAIADYRVQLDNAGPDAVGFVYYTGHGAQNTNNGHSYLLGTETMLRAPSDVAAFGVDLAEISADLHGAGARAVILVFDACRNITTGGDKGNVKGIGYLPAPRGMLVAYSADLGQLAREGLYAPELAAEIARPGQTVETLFAAVTHRVVSRSLDLGMDCANPDVCGVQRPFVEPRLYEPIYLAGQDGPALADATFQSAGPAGPAKDFLAADPEANMPDMDLDLMTPAESALFMRAYDAHLSATLILEESRSAEAQAREAAYRYKAAAEGCTGRGYEGSCDDTQGVRYGVHTYGGASQGESFAGRFKFGNRDIGLFQYPYRPDTPIAIATYEGEFRSDSINAAGNLNGLGTLTYQDGSIYSGQVRNGSTDGYALCTLRDGTEIYGRWSTGALKEWITRLPSGDRSDIAPPGCGKD